MLRNCLLGHTIVGLFLTVVCIFAEGGREMGKLEGKKILMIIASNNFRDEELQVPKEIFEREGAKVTIASSSLKESRGVLGATAKPDVLIGDVEAQDYDAVIFVGGGGSSEYWEDSKAHEIVRSTLEKGKLLGAICIAPVTLANAGVLNGKKATVWNSEAGKLSRGGATYTGAGVEIDGDIITANGPQSAKEFAEAFVNALTK